MLSLPPSCFAVCGHHLSPRIAIVLSLLSSVPNLSTSHSSICLTSNTPRSSLYISHSYSSTMFVLLSFALPQGHICASSSSSRLLVYDLCVLSGRSRSPTRNCSFQRFRVVHWAVQKRFHPNPFLNLRNISKYDILSIGAFFFNTSSDAAKQRDNALNLINWRPYKIFQRQK